MDFKKNPFRENQRSPCRQNLIPNKSSNAMPKNSIYLLEMALPAKGKGLEIQSEFRTTKSEQLPLPPRSTTASTDRSPNNYDGILKRQPVSACLEASIWHLQHRSDQQIQPLKTALIQSPIPAKLSCSAHCQQSSPS